MNDGISAQEACRVSPESLTAEQLQICREQESTSSYVPHVAVISAVIAIAIIVFVVVKLRNKKKAS